MQRNLKTADQAFHTRVHTFLDTHSPRGTGLDMWLDKDWCEALCEAQLAAPGWPQAWGGPGLSATRKFIWYSACNQRLTDFSESPAVALAGPLLARFGSAEVHQRYLPDIRQLRSRWLVALGDHTSLLLDEQRQLTGRASWLSGVSSSHYLLGIARAADSQDIRQYLFCCPLERSGISMQRKSTLAGGEIFQLEFDGLILREDEVICRLDDAATINLPAQQLGRSGVAVAQLHELDRVLNTLSEDEDLLRRRHAAAIEVAALEALEARYVDALERGTEPAFSLDLVALKAASVEQQVGSLLMDSFGYYALPYPDLWLQHNEGNIGPSGARAATQAWLEQTVSRNYASVSRDLYGKLITEQQDIGEL